MSLTPEFVDTCEGLNIIVVEPFYTTPVLETGLEIAEVLARRNQVTYLGPDVLSCATDETFHWYARLWIKLSRKGEPSKYLGNSVRRCRRAEIRSRMAGLEVPNAMALVGQSLGNLRELRFEDFDVGMGIISSLVSLTRDPHVEAESHREYACALGRDAITLYRLIQELIREHDYDLVIFFNGRMAPVRALRRGCEARGTRYIVSERGSSIGKYALFDRATPHQPEGMRHWVDTWWAASADPEADAQAFLAKRRKHQATDWYSFTGGQEFGKCPPRDGRKRVTFFTSSEDELVAIGDELAPDTPYCDQAHAILSVGQASRERGYEYLVRFHPNMPSTANALVEASREMASAVFEPTSDVDTYALIDSSDIVFTQGSTVGIEAAAVGKPVFYMGRNLFERCRSVHRVMNESDLSAALDSNGPTDPLDALKYANFFAGHGIPYRYYSPRGFFAGDFRGRDLNGPILGALRDAKLRFTRGGI